MNQSEIVNIIIDTINSIFSNFFTSIDNSIYDCLDKLVFIDGSIIDNAFFSRLLGASGKNGFLYICDAMLIAISLFYIIRYYYLNVIDITVEKPGKFFFKLLIFAIVINSSYFISHQLLDLTNLLSSSIQYIGKEILNNDISFSELINVLNKSLLSSPSDFNMFSLDGIIRSFISIELINLLLSYSIRYVLLQVLILFSPFSILSLINDSSSWIFKSWSKCLLSLLSIQLFIPLIIIVIFCTDNNNKILLIGGIYSLIRINDFIREMFGGISLNVSSNVSSLLTSIRSK